MCCIVFQVLGKLQCLEVHVSAEGTAGDNRFRLYAQSATIVKVSNYSVYYTPAVLEGIHVYGSHSVTVGWPLSLYNATSLWSELHPDLSCI